MFELEKFGILRVASVSPEIRVGNVPFNFEQICKALQELEKSEVQVAVFPELSLTGYTCGDLFYQSTLLKSVDLFLKKLIEFSKNINLVFIVGFPMNVGSDLLNCAGVIGKGKIYGIVHKTYLPNTREFYERRWFSDSTEAESVDINGEFVPIGNDLLFVDGANSNIVFGVEICQDLWSIMPRSSELCLAGAKVIFNLSASDEWIGKSAYRRDLVLSQSARCNAGYVYSGCGPWESSTDMVFSGHCLIAENGKLLAESRKFSFATDFVVADIDLELIEKERLLNDTFSTAKNLSYVDFRLVEINLPKRKSNKILRKINKYPFIPEQEESRHEVCEEIFRIQSTGLARRLHHIGAKDVVIGLSGGLDSSLALLVCLKSFQQLNFDIKGIHAVLMPGFGTTTKTFNNAKKLCSAFGIPYEVIDIKESVKKHLKEIGSSVENQDLVFENAQARERTQILMDLANKYKGIVVGTGDLSEIALGWATYNADHMSMYNVNAGVPKTLVRYIIQWYANSLSDRKISRVLQDILATPISPELVSNSRNEITQKTEEIVGPFDLNDFFLYYFVRYGFSPEKILFFASIAFKEEYTREQILHWLKNFLQRFFVNQFKRSCMPDGPKVGSVDLSPRGSWRMPSDADVSLWLKNLDNLK